MALGKSEKLIPKFFVTTLSLLLSLSSIALAPMSSAAGITSFDGTYVGTITITITTVLPIDPPQTITSPATTTRFSLLVKNGVITGDAEGNVLNSSGDAKMTYSVSGYGEATFTGHFVKDSKSGTLSFSGHVNWKVSELATLSGTYSLRSGPGFKFNHVTLPIATIGKQYKSGVSFCSPAPLKGQICGPFVKITNPTGGKPPYTFRLKTGSSDFLPRGMVLNFRTGILSGKPVAGQKTGIRNLVVCAYDANDGFTGVCQSTTLKLIG